MHQSQYEDYQYVLQDVTHVYIGAKFTYGRLQTCEEAPFKLRAIVAEYLLREAGAEKTIGEHVLELRETDLSYLVFKQLKARFKCYEWQEDPKGRRKKDGYVSRVYTLEELLAKGLSEHPEHPAVLAEVSFKKLAMMSVSL